MDWMLCYHSRLSCYAVTSLWTDCKLLVQLSAVLLLLLEVLLLVLIHM
jgi:hypothetical protein